MYSTRLLSSYFASQCLFVQKSLNCRGIWLKPLSETDQSRLEPPVSKYGAQAGKVFPPWQQKRNEVKSSEGEHYKEAAISSFPTPSLFPTASKSTAAFTSKTSFFYGLEQHSLRRFHIGCVPLIPPTRSIL